MRFIALQREQQENSSQTFDDATEALQQRISTIEAAAKSLGGALEKVNTSPASRENHPMSIHW
jgi:prefoldin subunit 5